MTARDGIKRRSRGLATIEFAICAPTLLMLMFATVEVSRLLYRYNTLTKAVRDGARYAVTQAAVGTTRIVNISTTVRTQTRNLVVNGNVGGTGAAILPGLTAANVTVTSNANGFVTVSAVYAYTPAIGTSLRTFGLGTGGSLSMPLNASVVMRAL